MLLLAFVSLAHAAQTRSYTGTSFGPDGASGSETFAGVRSVTVDQSTGDVFVYDARAEKIYKFDSDGQPVNFTATGTNAISGVGGGEGKAEYQIAVAPPGSPGGTAGDIYVAHNGETLKIFKASGDELAELAVGGEVCGVAVDPAGHVFTGAFPSSIKEYTPSGNPVVEGDKSGVESVERVNSLCNLAVDAAGHVYAIHFSGGIQKLESLGASSASTIDESSRTGAVDPVSGRFYGDDRLSISQYSPSGALEFSFAGGEIGEESFGVAVNHSLDHVYAADSGSGRVKVFGPAIVVPGAHVEAASGVSASAATLHGLVEPAGIAVTGCVFEYGLTEALGSSTPCEGSIPTDEGSHPVAAALTGLEPGTTYFYRVAATNANGTGHSGLESFTAKQPARTEAASGITPRRATLHGTAFPEGEEVTACFFEYGEATTYGSSVPCEGSTPSDQNAHPVSAKIAGLRPSGVVYHFRLVIERGALVARGADETLETAGTVTTGAFAFTTAGKATLAGTVDPAGEQVQQCLFEYGETEAYGESAPCAQSPAAIGSGETPVRVGAEVNGLALEREYHYRLSVVDGEGTTVHGGDHAFLTHPPKVGFERTTDAGVDYGMLEAGVLTFGNQTEAFFEYGTTTAYGQATAPVLLGGSAEEIVAEQLSGLAPATTYHWRLVVGNSLGGEPGPDSTFKTFPAPQPPETGCPNQEFRSGTLSADLPDCRAYEQVSPVDKHGASIQHDRKFVQAAADGSRLTFGDIVGLPSTGSSEVFVATRGDGAWSTGGLEPPFPPDVKENRLLGWDDNLTTSVNIAGNGIYLGDTSTDQYALSWPGQPGEDSRIAGFAHDASHLIFETNRSLVPDAPERSALPEGGANLYELNHGAVSLVGRIPTGSSTVCDDAVGPSCEVAPTGAFAGPFGGATRAFYTQNTISDDGSRIVFTAAVNHQLYLRENGTKTLKISAPQGVAPDPNGEKPATFVAATPSDSKIFFASCEKLTEDSSAISTAADSCTETEGQELKQSQDLYVFDTASGTLEDLSSDPEDSAALVGVLGASENGEYVYFAANGVLAPGAAPGDCTPLSSDIQAPVLGSCNIYLAHAGTVTFVSRISTAGKEAGETPNGGAENWTNFFYPASPTERAKSSRVSSNGVLVFSANESQSGYNQLYRYTPVGSEIDCISCNPANARPAGSASLVKPGSVYNGEVRITFLTRSVSTDGNRVFFETDDALVIGDHNSANDPYEWEADGSGSCRSSETNGGCLYLLSTGTSPEPSFFGDASASGDDVFIFTAQPLVGADKDQLVDAYDVRVNGGLASQSGAVGLPCRAEAACRGSVGSAPSEPSPGTSTFSGPGNAKPKKGSCKKKRAKACKKHKKHKHHERKQSRSKHSNRGGSQ